MVKLFVAVGAIGTIAALGCAYMWHFKLPFVRWLWLKDVVPFFYLSLIPIIWGSLIWAIRDWRRCLTSVSPGRSTS